MINACSHGLLNTAKIFDTPAARAERVNAPCPRLPPWGALGPWMESSPMYACPAGYKLSAMRDSVLRARDGSNINARHIFLLCTLPGHQILRCFCLGADQPGPLPQPDSRGSSRQQKRPPPALPTEGTPTGAQTQHGGPPPAISKTTLTASSEPK